jgi:hypothetical protein
MKHERVLTKGVGALLLCGVFAACDAGPTEPMPFNPAAAAGLFYQILPPGEISDDPSGKLECPAGGSVAFERGVSNEQEGEVTIRRTQLTKRYDGCAMMRGSTIITANGETRSSEEMHLEHEGATWPHGVLYQEAHEVGTLAMSYGDTKTHTCENDFVTIFEPAAGRFSSSGIRCGYRIDRTVYLPIGG